MKFQLLALGLTALATLTSATNVEFEGKYIRTEKLTHGGDKCLNFEVGVEEKGNRHHRAYIIPKCTSWQDDDEDHIYKLKVVKVLHNCLKWGIVVHGDHARPVCSKVQKRDTLEPAPQLVDRDDDDDDKNKLPEGKFIRTETVARPGAECHDWRPYVVKPGDKHNYPTIAPKCHDWQPLEDLGEDIIYDSTVIQVESGCARWRIAADGNYVRPFCAVGTGKGPYEALEMEPIERPATAPIQSSAPKGLLKDVQKTVHNLQSQLAQAQHKQHLAKVHEVEHPASGKQKSKTDEQSLIQEMQRTVQSMQTRLAQAKHSIHAHFSPAMISSDSGGIDQGVLQHLQTTVHTLQAQLAKARHVVLAHTGKTGAAKKMVDSGLDQGVLQHMQTTAHKLQSELAKARHALHASIGGKEAVPQVKEKGSESEGED